MKTHLFLLLFFLTFSGTAFAQNDSDKIIRNSTRVLDSIITHEKELLKEKIKEIDKMLDNKEISQVTAERMKREVSRKARISIHEKSKAEREKLITEIRKLREEKRKEIEYMLSVGKTMSELSESYQQQFDSITEKKYSSDKEYDDAMKKLDKKIENKNVQKMEDEEIFTYDQETIRIAGLVKISRKKGENVDVIEDINIFPSRKISPRTYGGGHIALAFHTLNSSEYFGSDKFKVWGSKSFEIGGMRSTRIFENSEWLRINYGYTFMFNKLKMKGDGYFVDANGVTNVENYPSETCKVKYKTTYLIFPVGLEFNLGGYYDEKGEKYRQGFRIGLGGYVGGLLGAKQKIKYYNENGNVSKTVSRNQLNANDWVYGLSAHIGTGRRAIYARYSLVPMFRNNPVKEYPLSIGVRWGI